MPGRGEGDWMAGKTKPEFDENGKLLNKEALIKKEKAKLSRSYAKMELKRKKNAESMIASAAFMAVSLLELEYIIDKKGYTEEYKNGANQSGVKKCSEVEVYNNMAKNYLAYMKQLDDMLLKDKGKEEGEDELMKFLAGGGK